MKKKQISLIRLLILGVIVIVFINCCVYLSYNKIGENGREIWMLDDIGELPVYEHAEVGDNLLQIKTFQEERNFVFIKCMKCATETMGTILRRFVYTHGLNFALPRKQNLYFGWPFPIEKQDIRPSSSSLVGLIEHAVYNHTFMSSFMPARTSYITIIREPWKHFLSTFSYFEIKQLSGIVSNEPVTEYLHNIDKYESIYKSHEKAPKRYCIPDGFSATKNLISHCLGMPLGFPHGRHNITSNLNSIHSYIRSIDKEFTLVMIMEYFHESLVLLKRLFHWDLKDIIYHHSNIGNYFYNISENEYNKDIHKHWSSVDYLLYDYFNKTFWKRVDKQVDFHDECEHFSKIQAKATTFCSPIQSVKEPDEHLYVARSKFNDEFIIEREDCNLMKAQLLELLKTRYDQMETFTDYKNPGDDAHPLPLGRRRGC